MDCECCGQNIRINFARQKFCISCSLYIHKLKKQNRYMKERIKVLNNRLDIEKLRLKKIGK